MSMHIGPLHLRALAADDMPLLPSIFAASRERELALMQWPVAQAAHFVQSQCFAQHRHYQEHYPQAEMYLLELAGQLAGRIYWQLGDDALHLIEITLMPAFRQRGFATLLIHYLQNLAYQHFLPMRLQVECSNPALALYQKLGFRILTDDRMYFQMQCESFGNLPTMHAANTTLNATPLTV